MQRTDDAAIVLVTPIDTDSAGVVNGLVPVEDVAATVALAMHADKLIVFHEPATFRNGGNDVNSDLSTDAFDELIATQMFKELTTRRMRALLYACRQGVNRGHVVSFTTDGALLAELFTADGSGTQISTDDYLTIRRAAATDTDVVLELMQTDIQQDRIVSRLREFLASSTTTLFLAEHDIVPVGCVALYNLVEDMQENGTLVAAPKHRDRNIGRRLLSHAELEAKKRNANHVFLFSKHAVDWFCKQNYQPSTLDVLPASYVANYDIKRQTTLLIKELV